MGGVGVRKRRIFPKDIKPLNGALNHLIGHNRGGRTDLIRQYLPPGFFKFFFDCRNINLLVTGVNIRQTAHVTGALNVVLTS